MRLTVAICTWNRADLLARTLERLTELEVPEGLEWELLVVDNQCSDHTQQVLDEIADRVPLVRGFEPEPGLSNARNRAISEATGEFILWTDDDVLVDSGWLTAYHRAMEEHPEGAFFGGPIEPWFEGGGRGWLRRGFGEVSTAFAVRDLSASSFRFTADPGLLPFGANYAVRRNAQRRHPYDPNLGRQRSSLASGEETALLLELLREGAEGWWVPEAKVRHFIPAERQTVAYLRRYYEAQGEHAAATSSPPAGRFSWRRRPAWMWKEAITSELRYRASRALRPPEHWIVDLKRAAYLRGRLRGVRRTAP